MAKITIQIGNFIIHAQGWNIEKALMLSMGIEQRVADKNRHNMNHNWVCFILSRYQKLTPKAMGILQDEFEFREIITTVNSYNSLALKI